jgi:hypothetical protein
MMNVLANSKELYKVNALLTEQQLVAIFGTADVGLQERASYFAELWDKWEDNQVILSSKPVKGIQRYKLELEYLDNKTLIKQFTDKHGLEEMIDYQIKGNVVRFNDSQFAFLFRLSV